MQYRKWLTRPYTVAPASICSLYSYCNLAILWQLITARFPSDHAAILHMPVQISFTKVQAVQCQQLAVTELTTATQVQSPGDAYAYSSGKLGQEPLIQWSLLR